MQGGVVQVYGLVFAMASLLEGELHLPVDKIQNVIGNCAGLATFLTFLNSPAVLLLLLT